MNPNNQFTARWYGQGSVAIIRNVKIPNGMIYISDVGGIPLGDEVVSSDSVSDEFLQWLADGKYTPIKPTSLSAYLYGLERRLLIDLGENAAQFDNAAAERQAIVSEIIRIRNIYAENKIFFAQASKLLLVEWTTFHPMQPLPDYITSAVTGEEDDEFLKAYLVHVTNSNAPLTVQIALSWFMRSQHKERLEKWIGNCQAKFRALFSKRFVQHPLPVQTFKPALKYNSFYTFINPSLRGQPGPQQAQIENFDPPSALYELVGSCANDLKPYNNYAAMPGAWPGSFKALALLPNDLRSDFWDPAKVRFYFNQQCANGPAIFNVLDIYTIFGRKQPDAVYGAEMVSLAVLLDEINLGIAPDFRMIPIKLHDKVAIYRKRDPFVPQPHEAMIRMANVLRLGAMVAQVDHVFSESEELMLRNYMGSSTKLSNDEKRYFKAYILWALSTSQGIDDADNLMIHTDIQELQEIGQTLVNVAIADNDIDAREVVLLENIFKKIGLNPNLVSQLLTQTVGSPNNIHTTGLIAGTFLPMSLEDQLKEMPISNTPDVVDKMQGNATPFAVIPNNMQSASPTIEETSPSQPEPDAADTPANDSEPSVPASTQSWNDIPNNIPDLPSYPSSNTLQAINLGMTLPETDLSDEEATPTEPAEPIDESPLDLAEPSENVMEERDFSANSLESINPFVPPAETEPDPGPTPSTIMVTGLDEKVRALLFRILTKISWKREILDDYALSMGLRLTVALKQINAWTKKNYGEELVDIDTDNETITLHPLVAVDICNVL